MIREIEFSSDYKNPGYEIRAGIYEDTDNRTKFAVTLIDHSLSCDYPHHYEISFNADTLDDKVLDWFGQVLAQSLMDIVEKSQSNIKNAIRSSFKRGISLFGGFR